MSEPSLALQATIVAALKGAAGVTAFVGQRIYDHTPADAVFPYISLGDMQVLPDKADCIDGVEVTSQVDVWSRTIGYPECKNIGREITEALDDQPLAVSGHHLVVFEVETVRYMRDPDGLTNHGVLIFRALLQPV